MNAVVVAVQNGHLDLLKRMDSHISDPDQSVYSTPNKVWLLALIIPVPLPISVFLPQTGLTVLHYVCCAGNPEILEWLLTEKKSACDKTINTKNKVHIIILLGGYHLLTHRKAILHCWLHASIKRTL